MADKGRIINGCKTVTAALRRSTGGEMRKSDWEGIGRK